MKENIMAKTLQELFQLPNSIETEVEYNYYLDEVKPYFEGEQELDSHEGARFNGLVTLIENYEAKHYPVDLPNPLDALKFRLEQAGLMSNEDAEKLNIKDFDPVNFIHEESDIHLYFQACKVEAGRDANFMAKCRENIKKVRANINKKDDEK